MKDILQHMPSIKIGDIAVVASSTAKNLEVILNKTMNIIMEAHINVTCRGERVLLIQWGWTHLICYSLRFAILCIEMMRSAHFLNFETVVSFLIFYYLGFCLKVFLLRLFLPYIFRSRKIWAKKCDFTRLTRMYSVQFLCKLPLHCQAVCSTMKNVT